ncbi:hypothetical protein GCM10011506_08170 [Marivirga lumbricoides]|uniref:Apea-like HEPN domain-containing protein n=1 Tax=Marivirga lumbricoides TaxID=1046115 RepID=A0ABQ1LJH9_9BACT|nr:hypothetical protein GCM10011506_08170 [Marivirga lumbricoides]
MWTVKNDNWNDKHTSLTKYFLELVKQRVDSGELISNRHRTTNGHTLLAEIILVASLVQSNPKFKSRLTSLINEARDKNLRSNIVNDFILKNYFPDIVKYFKDFDIKRLDHSNYFTDFLHNSRVKYERTLKHYFSFLTDEIKGIDYKNEEQFVRNSKSINTLVDLLIPYLLYVGYSATSISDLAFRYVSRQGGVSAIEKFLKNFDTKDSEYKFLFKVPLQSLEFKFMKDNLNEDKVKIKPINFDKVKSKILQDGFEPKQNEELFEVTTDAMDPHNFIRAIYDVGLKRFVASKERMSLSFFNQFFDNILWRFSKASEHKYIKSSIYIDPINTPFRVNTLKQTLSRLSKEYDFDFNKDSEIPHIESLFQPIYFYHLALGSKSIENSLSLLWTSLETLLPYRNKSSDIENVKVFVSKSLSIGSLGRDIMSLAVRLIETNKANENKLSTLGTPQFGFKPSNIVAWANWLTTSFDKENDPFYSIKESSNLLCTQFCHLNDVYSGKIWTCSDLLERIKGSSKSISYQLDRIYLHRNQIVHSGKFINEYSNLWSNLEWYVGKLLSLAVYNHLVDRNYNIENIYQELEGDYEQIMNLLEVNRNKKVSEIQHHFPILFEHSWQSF